MLARHGVPLPHSGVAETPDEAEAAARDLEGRVVLKSQVLTGGRMKAGGVQFANTPTLHNSHSEFDASGRAIVTINTPVLTDPLLLGLTFYHAYIVYDLSHRYYMASNPVPLTLVF